MSGLSQPRLPSIYNPPVKRLEKVTRDYVAGDDCQVFINSTYVDQIAQLQYQVVNSKRPVYGYHSPFLEGMLPGQELVQGRLTVYKIVDNYLKRTSQGFFEGVSQFGGTQFQFAGRETSGSTPTDILNYLRSGNEFDFPPPLLHPFLAVIAGEVSFSTYLDALNTLRTDLIPGISDDFAIQVGVRKKLIDLVLPYKGMLLARAASIYGDIDKFIQMIMLSDVWKAHLASHHNQTGISAADLAGFPTNYKNNSGLEDVFMAPFNLTVYMGVIVTDEVRKNDFAIVGQMQNCHIVGHASPHETTGAPITVAYDFIAQRYNETHVKS